MAEFSQPIFGDSRAKLLIGELPPNFLKVSNTTCEPDTDRQLAMALDQQLNYVPSTGGVTQGRLKITVDQAKLTKNYGLISKMDPYVRLRVGHCVYETHTDSGGGKNPRWNKSIQCLVSPGVDTINIEIYDECTLKMDELIAWTQIIIPREIYLGETHEEWYPLNGKQGEGLEGSINLVLSYSTGPQTSFGFVNGPPVMMVPRTGSSFHGNKSYTALPVYPAPVPITQIQQAPPTPVITQETLSQIEEMFPNLDKDVIKSVVEVNNGNRDAAINSLLQMS